MKVKRGRSIFRPPQLDKIESNVTLYDSEFEPLELEETGTMTKKWDGNYYVTSDNSKETFKLNPEVVSYNENNSQVTLYGDIYKVLFDGQVEKYSKDTEIKNTSEIISSTSSRNSISFLTPPKIK